MQKLKFEYRITLAYLIIGGIWIVFSDKLLNFFIKDPDFLTRFQTYKGWFYVIITSILFYSFLNRHLVKIRNAEQKAKESDRLKTAFIQNISHEIRTPMNGIIGFVELLRENNISATEKTQFLEIITESSNQLLNIVNEVLDMSLIETGNIQINKKEVNLNDFSEELYHLYRPLIKREISFSVIKGLTEPSDIVLMDDIKVKQILTNLLNNAIKFTDNGHIKFGYTLKNIELEFFVEDTGIGIDSTLQDKVFERFRKAESNNTRLYDGVGLGLAICKGNIDLLKGRIWIKSEPGIGSVFFFTIPYIPVSGKETMKSSGLNNINKLNDLTILIAEDDEPNYLYIKEILKGQDVTIYRAVNGKEAVEICRNNNKIGIILMDLKMPVMSGNEAIKLIREFRPDLPIIAQTAFAMNDEKEDTFKAGCSDYISKPFKKDQLLELIEKYQKTV
jgi:signal transduction histidine kinase/ActR/RegA family two-component response regulator